MQDAAERQSPFLDKRWLDTWAKHVGENALLSLHEKGMPQPCCYVSRKAIKKFGIFSVRHINQTGIHQFDQPWIEYNGLRLPPDCSIDIYASVIKKILSLGTDEISLSMATNIEYWQRVAAMTGTHISTHSTLGFAKN